jgi:hypothetical protein
MKRRVGFGFPRKIARPHCKWVSVDDKRKYYSSPRLGVEQLTQRRTISFLPTLLVIPTYNVGANPPNDKQQFAAVVPIPSK